MNLEWAKQACLDAGLVIDDPGNDDLLSAEATPVEPLPQTTEKSPSSLALDSPQTMPRNWSHLMLSEMNSSPTMLSTITGHMASEVSHIQTSRSEKARTQAAVARWIVTSTEDPEDPRISDPHDIEDIGQNRGLSADGSRSRRSPGSDPIAMAVESPEALSPEHQLGLHVRTTSRTTAPPSAKVSSLAKQDQASLSEAVGPMSPFTRAEAFASLPTFVPERRHTAASLELSIGPRSVHFEAASQAENDLVSAPAVPPARRLSDSAISQKSQKSRHDSGQGHLVSSSSRPSTDKQHLAP